MELGLEGTVNFGSVAVQVIMRAKMDMEVARHVAVQRTMSSTPLLKQNVEASLWPKLHNHNPKPEKDNRLWNVWHLHHCQGLDSGKSQFP
jgi:hypothetical protein